MAGDGVVDCWIVTWFVRSFEKANRDFLVI